MEKANEFNKYFATVGIVDNGNLPDCPDIVDDNNCLTSVTITESEVLFAINRMKNNFSCPDDLPPALFKQLKHTLAFPSHCFLISYCLLLLYLWTGEMQLLYLSLSCLLYTSPSPRDRTRSRMPSSA